MMRVSRKVLLAIEAILDIAYHGGGKAVQSRAITRRQGIPPRYLEQTLQKLVRGGVLVGVRGPQGGYRLARERRRITVGEIVRIVRGPKVDAVPTGRGSALARRIVRPLWHDLDGVLMDRLDAITIDELCARAGRAGIASPGHRHSDASI